MIKNPVPWPNGARCAVAITFDIDTDSILHLEYPDLRYKPIPPRRTPISVDKTNFLRIGNPATRMFAGSASENAAGRLRCLPNG